MPDNAFKTIMDLFAKCNIITLTNKDALQAPKPDVVYLVDGLALIDVSPGSFAVYQYDIYKYYIAVTNNDNFKLFDRKSYNMILVIREDCTNGRLNLYNALHDGSIILFRPGVEKSKTFVSVGNNDLISNMKEHEVSNYVESPTSPGVYFKHTQPYDFSKIKFGIENGKLVINP